MGAISGATACKLRFVKFGFAEINSDVAFLKVTPSEPYNYCFRKFGKLTSPAILDSFIKSGYFSLLS